MTKGKVGFVSVLDKVIKERSSRILFNLDGISAVRIPIENDPCPVCGGSLTDYYCYKPHPNAQKYNGCPDCGYEEKD